jgi:hypothetical protein
MPVIFVVEGEIDPVLAALAEKPGLLECSLVDSDVFLISVVSVVDLGTRVPSVVDPSVFEVEIPVVVVVVGEAVLLALPQPPPPVGTSLTFGSFPPVHSVRMLGILTGIGILLDPAEPPLPWPTIELAFLALVRLAAAAAIADAVLW